MDNSYLSKFIENTLAEDIGDGDHTSLACIPLDAKGKARLLAKEDGVLAGVDVAVEVFKKLDPSTTFSFQIPDGSIVKSGDEIFIVSGRTVSILQAERTILNIIQRMSGIATITRKYVQKLEGLKTKILDTRKTTPGMRFLEKEAVKIGGGTNHRFGLFDMILIKDNHIDYAGGIQQAIKRANDYLQKNNKNLNIEIEARSIADVQTIMLTGNVQRIMLDNFSINQTREAVKLIGGRFEIESSGGITYENLRDYAECGVDFISVGALTHHIKSLDFSLKAIDFNGIFE
ncbi:MAG: carboxylating nicotinate-nucleotide diphosphorylase [Bacteroidales bacterium]|nr:carboxylating nicotinate-nucleotide diphosphorylase [Bacteroidales bacterium]